VKLLRQIAVLLTFVVGSLSMAVDQASAVTTEIGAVMEIRAHSLPSPTAAGGFTVQVAEAAGTYAVPPGYGTITAWSHSTGTVPGTLTFKVYRPTGALREFSVVASDTRTVTASTVQSFPVQIPVRPGDRIGLSADEVQLAYQSDDPADQIGFFGAEPPLGATRATDGDPFQDFKLDVAATLQSAPDAPSGGQPPPGGPPPAGSQSTGSPSPTAPLSAAAKLRVSPRTFAAARRGPSVATKPRTAGAKVSYSVNVPSTVRFTVRQERSGRRKGRGKAARCVAETRLNRKAAECTRTVTLPEAFKQTARGAANGFRFTGRLGGRPLKPGPYMLVATPTASGRSGRSASSRFRIR